MRLTTGDSRIFDLDLAQGVTRIQDLNGNILAVALSGITHSSGEGIDFDRDTEGRITRISDPASKTIEYTYDTAGDLITVQDQVGATTRLTYDGDHRLSEIEDPRGVTAVRNEYDEDSRLIAVTDANGNRTEFTHDLAAQRELVRDRRGNVTISSYDDAGNVIAQTDALGGTSTYSYDARGNKLTHTLATGGTSTFAYDADGNVAYTYDSENRLIAARRLPIRFLIGTTLMKFVSQPPSTAASPGSSSTRTVTSRKSWKSATDRARCGRAMPTA